MESLSRVSGMLETARDLTLEAARDASNMRRTTTRTTPAAQLKKLLDSRSEREVLEGLRRVIAMTYRCQHTLPFFSAVVKNIASPNLEIKKLVYIYLLHHAEAEPDTALLSINTIQKSLRDSNPQVRALALRVMSGIKVPVISQIVSLGIKGGVGDMSPYVRKAAALAIPKCYRLDPNTLPQLLEHLSILLGDKQYYVVGAAVAAFLEICPERLELIHGHYRSLIRKLVDMDEWGQLATLQLMLVYARKCFPRRTRRVKKPTAAAPSKGTKGFYDDSSDESPDDDTQYTTEAVLDPDLALLLNAMEPLLSSRNSAVVVAVTRCFLYLGDTTHISTAIGPLIALLRTPTSMQQIALHNIVQICLLHPQLFVPHYRHFFIRATDSPQIWTLKLELLTLIFPCAPARLQSLILAELSHFSRSGSSYDASLVREAVRAIGRCAQSSQDPGTSARCLRLLLAHIGTADAHLVAESLEVIRHLIQRDPDAHRNTVVRLAKHLDVATSPQARASIIWLVGEFAAVNGSLSDSIAPDVLRILVKGFADEQEPAKLQILLLAAKVYLHHLNETQPHKSQVHEKTNLVETTSSTLFASALEGDDAGFRDTADDVASPEVPSTPEHPIILLWQHTLLLIRYDTSYNLRDRARVFRNLLSVPSSTALASLLLLAPKPVPQIPNPSSARKNYTLGSASLAIGDEVGVSGLRGYKDLPEWVKAGDEPGPRLRDAIGASKVEYGEKTLSASEQLDRGAGITEPVATPHKANGVKEKTLDDWLAEDDAGEEESEETETESEETEEESDDDDEEEYEEETDDDDDDEHDRLVK
ncbi:AP-3 complex beta3B subunit [Pseudovirgaria hyperparasitica]|uniref:AP-3 complex beta3B subunit n=1 Tax=Pseudovirgaria hyperparasitica TaxID=470096 RepID=A0A6A6VXJ5_9PEZI|nr:AP-3 complex beta3B subunit [Pseudovirgaria hyperparasitica]KAF2754549.1 AP-3 complex beta3B subunit [Pseudovirgaria hyperparasitica]